MHESLQTSMEANVGIVRTEEELAQGLVDIERIGAEAATVKAHPSSQYNPAWHEALDLRNLLISAEATTRSAKLRQESRGAHTRLDYEGEREEGLEYNVVVRKGSDGMIAEKVQRADPPAELSGIAHASLEELEGTGV